MSINVLLSEPGWGLAMLLGCLCPGHCSRVSTLPAAKEWVKSLITAASCRIEAHQVIQTASAPIFYLIFFKILSQILRNNLGRGETIVLLFFFAFIFLPNLAECIVESETWPLSALLCLAGKAVLPKAVCLSAPSTPLPGILDVWASPPFWECDVSSLVWSLDGNPCC